MALGAIVMLGTAVMLGSCATTAEKAQREAEQRRHVAEQVGERNFKIVVDYMYPQRYPSRPITSEFWLELKGDRVNPYLPYFGQSQMPSLYGIDEGPNVESEVRDYREQHNTRKHRTEIQFSTRTNDDTYHYVVYIYDDGKAEIYLRSNRRDSIRYSGEVI